MTGENLQQILDLTTLDKGMAFHCFRHTFATMLKNAEEPERLIEELMGHKSSSQSLGRYGKPYKTEIRARAINTVQYGLIPCPKRVSDTYYDEDLGRNVHSAYLVCGETNIEIDPDGRKEPLALQQYQRPDLHGYSPFHTEIPNFLPENSLFI